MGRIVTGVKLCPLPIWGDVLEFGDLKIMVTPLRAPSDGPIGDSSLSLDDGTASILNQNDSHPLDLDTLLNFSKPEASFTRSDERHVGNERLCTGSTRWYPGY